MITHGARPAHAPRSIKKRGEVRRGVPGGGRVRGRRGSEHTGGINVKAMAEFIVKVADLVEAEGRCARSVIRAEARELRLATARFALAMGLAAAGGLLAIAAIGLWLAAVYLGVRDAAGPAWGAAAAGLVGAALGAACIWAGRRTVST